VNTVPAAWNLQPIRSTTTEVPTAESHGRTAN
jgi:hypothetical protein